MSFVCMGGEALSNSFQLGAGEIAEARGDDLDEDRVRSRGEGTRDHGVLACFARGADGATSIVSRRNLGINLY
jgi:hypothetical protein